MTLKLTSTALAHGGQIPSKYTCDGQDVSPPLAWSGVPPVAKSLVLIVDDPDAPDPAAPKMTWVHWVLYNIPPSASSLPEAARQLPAGTLEGMNDWKRTGYGGPCPPPGKPHRYFFKIYALDTKIVMKSGATKRDLESAMEKHILAQGQLMGTYKR